MKKALVVLALLSTSLTHAALLAAEPVAKSHGLMTVDKAWTSAMLANDPAACAALYAEDAVLVLPGTGAIKGRKAIADVYAGWMKDVKVVAVSVTEAHYASGGDVSGGWGEWSVTTVPRAGGDPTTETGTWSAVAVKKNGVWLYASDHASGNPAPAK